MGKDKKERNPADAFRKDQRKQELKKLKKSREVVREVRDLLDHPQKIEEEIQRVQRLSDENKLDKGLKDRIAELKRMKVVAHKKQQMDAATGKRPREDDDDNDQSDDDKKQKLATSSSSSSNYGSAMKPPAMSNGYPMLYPGMPIPFAPGQFIPPPPPMHPGMQVPRPFMPNAFGRGLPMMMGGMNGIPPPPPRPGMNTVMPYTMNMPQMPRMQSMPYIPPPPPPLTSNSNIPSAMMNNVPYIPPPPPQLPSVTQQPTNNTMTTTNQHQQQNKRKQKERRQNQSAVEFDPLDPSADKYTERFGRESKNKSKDTTGKDKDNDNDDEEQEQQIHSTRIPEYPEYPKGMQFIAASRHDDGTTIKASTVAVTEDTAVDEDDDDDEEQLQLAGPIAPMNNPAPAPTTNYYVEDVQDDDDDDYDEEGDEGDEDEDEDGVVGAALPAYPQAYPSPYPSETYPNPYPQAFPSTETDTNTSAVPPFDPQAWMTSKVSAEELLKRRFQAVQDSMDSEKKVDKKVNDSSIAVVPSILSTLGEYSDSDDDSDGGGNTGGDDEDNDEVVGPTLPADFQASYQVYPPLQAVYPMVEDVEDDDDDDDDDESDEDISEGVQDTVKIIPSNNNSNIEQKEGKKEIAKVVISDPSFKALVPRNLQKKKPILTVNNVVQNTPSNIVQDIVVESKMNVVDAQDDDFANFMSEINALEGQNE